MTWQLGFSDLSDRLEQLEKQGDPLARLAEVVDFEMFRAQVGRIWENPGRKSAAGRKPKDPVLMLKVLVIQALYNLSDDQTEYQIRDRLSFMSFLGLGLGEAVPDAKTIWAFRERLKEKNLFDEVFGRFEQHLNAEGYRASKGNIVDACIIRVPRSLNSRAENEQLKKGETPDSFKGEENENKRRQKDTDARWTMKRGKSYFGYKNHVVIDNEHKLIRKHTVTPANRGDVKELENLLDVENTAKDWWGDAAYKSKDVDRLMAERELCGHFNERGTRSTPLSEEQRQRNRERSRTRARVEHVFGWQAQRAGGTMVRVIGKARADIVIGMRNLVYNMSRFGFLSRRPSTA